MFHYTLASFRHVVNAWMINPKWPICYIITLISGAFTSLTWNRNLISDMKCAQWILFQQRKCDTMKTDSWNSQSVVKHPLDKACMLQATGSWLFKAKHRLSKGAKLLIETTLNYWSYETTPNKKYWNLTQNRKSFFCENTFENVICKMAAIFFKSDGLQYNTTGHVHRENLKDCKLPC